jgi:hypothetical protein
VPHEGFSEAELFDAVQAGGRALAGMDWQRMQPRAVAYAVLVEALPYLRLALVTREQDRETSREQAARDALALDTRARYPWIHQESRGGR